jgi:hypothetical protein
LGRVWLGGSAWPPHPDGVKNQKNGTQKQAWRR